MEKPKKRKTSLQQKQKQRQSVIVNIGDVKKKKPVKKRKNVKKNVVAPPQRIRIQQQSQEQPQQQFVYSPPSFGTAQPQAQINPLNPRVAIPPPVSNPPVSNPLSATLVEPPQVAVPVSVTRDMRVKTLDEHVSGTVGGQELYERQRRNTEKLSQNPPASGGGSPSLSRQSSVQERIQDAIKRTRAPNRPLEVRLAEQESKTEKLRQRALKATGMTAEQVGFERQDTVLSPVDVPITLDDYMRGKKSLGAEEISTQTVDVGTQTLKPKLKIVESTAKIPKEVIDVFKATIPLTANLYTDEELQAQAAEFLGNTR